MMENANPVWVIADQENCNLLPVTLQLVGKARSLADDLGVSVEVVLLGDGVEAQADNLFGAGADRVYLGNDPELANYHPDVYTDVIVGLAEVQEPQIVLLGSTSMGRELAPLVAARLKTGLTAHCIDLCINKDKILEQVIPAYGGEITIVCPERKPQMATVAQGVFPLPVPDEGRTNEIVPVEGPFQHKGRVEILEVVMEEPEGIPLDSAACVLAGGAGAGDHNGWDLIARLAKELGAGLGCTRPAVDEGWAELETMIGQSGKMVSPETYLGIGLSGEQQHMVGIAGAKTMVAVNNDRKSPVFNQVDFGVVDDCREFLPVLLEKIREYREKQASC
ncbi:MAG: electron transfer flavoprotein subunit alpha/FixB family protein [Thermodesulfobacteriota bacterium]